MNQERIKEIISAISRVKVSVYGDFCLDAYWIMEPRGSEVSLETGLKAEAVKCHYYTPGGASNIAANLAALKPASVRAIGVIGHDIFGKELVSQLQSLGIDTGPLIVQNHEFDTYTFAKKYRSQQEEPRIDFGMYNKRSPETDDFIVGEIAGALENSDILVFNQQVPGSITNPEFIRNVNRLFSEFSGKIVLLDSRHYNEQFKNVYRKTNAFEIARMNGVNYDAGVYIPMKKTGQYAGEIYRQFHKPVFVTCGERGIIVFDDDGLHEIRGIRFLRRLDTVGAGDTVLSALALCLGAGLKAQEAAAFANFAAAVTVQKLFTTGTASAEEILQVANDPDYIYSPDLAENPEEARFIDQTKIEICDSHVLHENLSIRHAVFDHDGTISTLRHGWETVMEKIMIDSIAGDLPEDHNHPVLAQVRKRVREYISRSTGIQTLLQMEALEEMVREFDLVPADRQADKFEYKKRYNRALLEYIHDRLEKVKSNPSKRNQFIIPGAVDFLEALRGREVILYLASGTDKEYVEEEAAILGYAGLFNGGIYGAVEDIHLNSKKRVIENIIKKHNLKGSELAVFGDGPVEIRECRKQEGLAVGLATNEDSLKGINLVKRSRLVKAGADIIVPDFREPEKIIELLFTAGS